MSSSSRNPFSNIHDLIARLAAVPSQVFQVHEKVLCRQLDIKPKEGLSVRDQLGELLAALKKGGTGNWQLDNAPLSS